MTTLKRRMLFSIGVLCLLATRRGQATDCFYPNGDLDTSGVAPCSSGSVSACCPFGWECLANGLCFLTGYNYTTRYTCTDRTWASSSCPQFCTNNNTAYGNEAIIQCDDGKWYCDRDRNSYNACTEADPTQIDYGQGSIVATISTTQPLSSVSSITSESSSLDTSASPTTSSSASSSPTSSPQPTTYSTESTTTNSAGVVSTVVVISTAAAITAPATSAPHPSSSNRVPLIIGLAAGIPVAAIVASALGFLFYRRRRGSPDKPPSYPNSCDTDNMIDMYAKPPNTTEIDSFPVAIAASKPGRQSQISELSGSPSFAKDSHSPTVSNITTKGEGLASPVSIFGGNSTGLAQVKEEPQELWGGPVPHDWAQASPHTSGTYTGFTPYQSSGGHPSPTSRAVSGEQQYVAYRPLPSGEQPNTPATPEFGDQGQLGRGLEVVNI